MIYAAISIFAIAYILMLVFSKYRPYIALGAALIFIISGMLPLNSVVESIDFNVLLMIAGTMGIVALFIESKMPELLADLIMEKVPNVMWAAVAMSLFAGVAIMIEALFTPSIVEMWFVKSINTTESW